MALDTPSAVRFFPVDHPAVANTLRAQLEERVDQLIAQLEYSQSWDDFNQRRGRVLEAREAVEMCRRTERELMER